ncbi:ORF6C domain-containing protein [Clostridium sp.]|uniref:ORF6C domain-containing protein n=1 Tax=Clostridium sp. TaxID=1506 RepID=UPI0025BD5376|nr:ORF6C domain-containing protein [Clostridium sp.]
MNKLIKINSNNTVSGRELHKFLEIGTRFDKWFIRMCEYGFNENDDFIRVAQKCPTLGGTQTIIDYAITLDMAKEISMLQRTEKGKQARQYFINCEKKLKEVVKKPLTTLEQLKLHYLALDEQNKELKQVKADVTDLKNNMPLFNIECKDLQQAVRAKGCEVLGGYGSKAYKSNSIRQKVYIDIQHQLKREFGVSRYEAIKRQYLATAHMIVENYEPPTYLINEIYNANMQIPFDDLGQVAY